MKEKVPTVKDVAKAAGVTAATVSNVLRGKMSEVSPSTAELVLSKVSELGYVRNMTASALSSRRSSAISLIMIGVFDLSVPKEQSEPNPFYGELAIRMEREARERGYSMTMFAGEENEYEQFVLQHSIDAAILCGVTPRDTPLILRRRDLRFVLFDATATHPIHMTTRTDEELGGRIAAEHLAAKGHRNITFVGPPLAHDPGNITAQRCYGARGFCKDKGITFHHFEAWTHFSRGVDAGRQLAETETTAVIASSDIVAAGLLAGLQEKGRRIPEDTAVIGYDNLPFAGMTFPTLTTIDQGLQQKIQYAMDLVVDGKPGESRVVKPALVERQST